MTRRYFDRRALLRAAIALAGAPVLLQGGEALAVKGTGYDIGGNGSPVITASLGGSATGDPSQLADLIVTVSFGDVSPLNLAAMVQVLVPVGIRARGDYQVRGYLSGGSLLATPPDSESLALTDVGFGIVNMRPVGARAKICTRSNHIIYSPYTNDPRLTSSISGTGRVQYQATLGNLSRVAGTPTLLMSGPELSQGPVNPRQADNGWGFDVVMCIVPQFFTRTTGAATVQLTLVINAGPGVLC